MSLIRDTHGDIRIRAQGVTARPSFTGSSLLAVALLTAGSVALAGNLDKVLVFNIPAESLDKALLQFGAQAHVQVSFASKSTKGQARTKMVIGNYTGQAALDQLLWGSQLTFVLRGNTVEIVPSSSIASETRSHSNPVTDPPAGDASHKTVSEDKPKSRTSSNPGPAGRHEPPALREVLVTGTHIRGIEPAYPVTTITRAQILATGLPTIGDVVRELPEDFNGGDNPGVEVTSAAINGASTGLGVQTVNLRGIGAGSTLVLVNGQRLAYDGRTSAVDISLIPTAAVQQVDIQTGGSSAIYGSDAVAGVVNIILRSDFDGAESSAYTETAQDGGGFQQRYSQLIGKTFSGGSALLGYEYAQSDSLRAGQRAQTFDASSPSASIYGEFGGTYIFPALSSHTMFLNTDYDLTSNLQSHLYGIYTHRTAFQIEPGEETNDALDEFGSDAGVSYAIDADRYLGVDVTTAGTSEERQITSPVPELFSLNQLDLLQTRELDIEGHGSWKLLALPGGTARVAFGTGFRRDSFDVEGTDLPGIDSRHIADAYTELSVPAVGHAERLPGCEALSFDVAVRYEHYSDFGSTANPTLGTTYVPVRAVTLNGTWGRSFSAPSLYDMEEGTQVELEPGSRFGLSSPASEVLYNVGSGRALGPERAKTWTATLQYAPDTFMEPMMEVTYYGINYLDRIASPILNVTTALQNPLDRPFIVENPDLELQNDIISGARSYTNPFNEEYDPANVVAVIDELLQNISTQDIHGIDADASYRLRSAIGELTGDIDGSWLSFVERVQAGLPSEGISGTLFNPPKFKMRVTLGWSRDSWHVNTFVNHIAGEVDVSAMPAYQIGPWTTVDGQVGYSLSSVFGTDATARIDISAFNVLNSTPPRVPAQSTDDLDFDGSNGSVLGRAFALSGSVKW